MRNITKNTMHLHFNIEHKIRFHSFLMFALHFVSVAATVTSECMQENAERVECGWYGIRKEQCLSTGCCWQPSNNGDTPWCYHEIRESNNKICKQRCYIS